MLDVFKTDAFSVVSLTAAINKAPHKPTRIGTLGLFREKGITTTTVVVEEKAGQLELIGTSQRGEPATTLGNAKRKVRSFAVPHLEKDGKIYADSLQGVRVFGSEDATQAVQATVDEKLAELRGMHDATLEHLRIGAIKGEILDSDGSTVLFNLFDEFGVVQQTEDIALGTAGTNVRNKAVAIARKIEAELGATQTTGYRAFCGDAFFDALVGHAKVEGALQYQESRLLRTDLRAGFEFGGIVWENYRGKVGSVDFINTDLAYVVPEGTDIFQTNFAPADFLETVNTIGLPAYAKMAFDDELNRWVKVHTQSNPLALCLRPRAVVKVTKS